VSLDEALSQNLAALHGQPPMQNQKYTKIEDLQLKNS
jgi:hypothetical protein